MLHQLRLIGPAAPSCLWQRIVARATTVSHFGVSRLSTAGSVPIAHAARFSRRAAPRRVIAMASMDQLEDRPALSKWTPSIVESEIVQLQKTLHSSQSGARPRSPTLSADGGGNTAFNRACTSLFERMHGDGAPLLLQEQVFNMWCRVRHILLFFLLNVSVAFGD
jgi:hypothetical protein